MKKIAFCLFALCAVAQAQAFDFVFGYTTGKYISQDTGYATFGVFTPYARPDWLTFVDLKGYRFERNHWGASAGVGGRFMLPCYGALGLNVYYDYLGGQFKGEFHQVGAGLEWLNPCWDIRLNGYFPVGNHSQFHKKCFYSDLGDGFMASRGRLEYAFSGADLEAGMHLWNRWNLNFYGALGPYYYSAHEHKRHFYGATARLRVYYKDYVYVQVRVSHDREYHTRVQGSLEVRIPLEVFLCMPRCGCDWFTQGVYRQGVIMTDRCCTWSWNW
jgi:hypothetical protein